MSDHDWRLYIGDPVDLYGQTFTVNAVWKGSSIWPEGDWRRSLSAYVPSSRLQDARLLRQALWTIRADKR